MRVWVNGEEFQVEFKHWSASLNWRGGWDPARERTSCMISWAASGEPMRVEAMVVRYHLDAPDREKARRAALAKTLCLLDNLYPIGKVLSEVPTNEYLAALPGQQRKHQMRRQIFWNAYLHRREYAHSEEYGVVDLGICCCCEKAGLTVRNVVSLPVKSPEPGIGCWGCLQCGLPSEGATAVVCDSCLQVIGQGEKQIEWAVLGEPRHNRRIPVSQLIEAFGHDLSKHPEEEEAAAGMGSSL